MGGGELRRGEALSVGSEMACEAIVEAVVAGSTACGFSLHCKGRQSAESNGSDGKKTKHL